jgi:hypothetical protein
MGRPAGAPDPARRARAAERARSHPTHQSPRPHLRGTSGFRGNFGQPQLPGCSATAGSSAVNSGSRKRRAICRPGRAAGGASGAPGTGAQPRHPAGHSPAWCAPGPACPAVPQCAPGINRRPSTCHIHPAPGPAHRAPLTHDRARIMRTGLVPDPYRAWPQNPEFTSRRAPSQEVAPGYRPAPTARLGGSGGRCHRSGGTGGASS